LTRDRYGEGAEVEDIELLEARHLQPITLPCVRV